MCVCGWGLGRGYAAKGSFIHIWHLRSVYYNLFPWDSARKYCNKCISAKVGSHLTQGGISPNSRWDLT